MHENRLRAGLRSPGLMSGDDRRAEDRARVERALRGAREDPPAPTPVAPAKPYRGRVLGWPPDRCALSVQYATGEDVRASTHESGHALVAHLLAFDVTAVSAGVRYRADGRREVGFVDYRPRYRAFGGSDRAHALVAAAGPAAERLAGYGRSTIDEGDLDELAALCVAAGVKPDAQAAWFEKIAEDAEALLARDLDRLDRLAMTLLTRPGKHLAGDALRMALGDPVRFPAVV